MILPLTIITLLITAMAAPGLFKRFPKAHRLLAMIPFFLLLQIWPDTFFQSEPSTFFDAFSISWVPSLGVNASFRLDGLGFVFALLVLGIGSLIVLYTGSYLAKSPKRPRVIALLFLFMAAMLGVVISDNIYLMFLFWELTSISSYLLIGFYHEQIEARKKALQALVITGSGGLALLAGLVLLHLVSGTAQWSELNRQLPLNTDDVRLTFAVILIILGALTKSAQFPFHFWLPNAMAAPTPISAYLHSATMVKAGVYLLFRFNPVFHQIPLWQDLLTWTGGITMLWAAFLGLWQKDLKRILAYTTLSVLGILVFLIGLNHDAALKAALLFLLGHAFYKAALFMTTGIIDQVTQTRTITELRGLRAVMPITAAAAALAAFSKAGFPPLFGFLGKEYLYKAGLSSEGPTFLLLTLALLTNMLLMAMALKTGIHPFFGKASAKVSSLPAAKDPAWELWLPPLLLSVLGLFLGLFPFALEQPLLNHAATSLTLEPFKGTLSLWHGFNLPLLLSFFTLAGGIVLYLLHPYTWRSASKVLNSFPFTWEKAYEWTLAFVIQGATRITDILQTGHLPRYIIVMVASTLFLFIVGVPDISWQWPSGNGFSLFGFTVIALMIAATIYSSVTQRRIAALLSLGIVGLGMAMIFLLYSAPDLAITQLIVETLVLVLFMFVIYRLPKMRKLSSTPTRVRDGILALAIGVAVFFLVVTSLNLQLADPIGYEMGKWSYTLAKGKNVVNVILVDFRAMDTMGEILVLTVAAIGVVALIRMKPKQKSIPSQEEEFDS